MNDIDVAEDISEPLVYHHFSATSESYFAAVGSAADRLRDATVSDSRLPSLARLNRALEVHVDWVEANSTCYQALLQGGVSVDPQIQAIIEKSRAETVERIALGMDIHHIPASLRIALRGWVGFLESACLDWLTTQDISKPQLVQLLSASLVGAIRAAYV